MRRVNGLRSCLSSQRSQQRAAAGTTTRARAAAMRRRRPGERSCTRCPPRPPQLFYPALVAEELGFFEEENVQPDLAPAAEEIAATAFLDNGDADVAFADVDEIILARSKGGAARGDLQPPAHQHRRHRRPGGQRHPGHQRAWRGRPWAWSRRRAPASSTPCSMPPASRRTTWRRRSWGPAGRSWPRRFEDDEIQAYVGNASDFTALEANGVPLRNITPADVGRIDGNPLAVLPDTLREKRRRSSASFAPGPRPSTWVRSTARWSKPSCGRRCRPSGATRPAARPRSTLPSS